MPGFPVSYYNSNHRVSSAVVSNPLPPSLVVAPPPHVLVSLSLYAVGQMITGGDNAVIVAIETSWFVKSTIEVRLYKALWL